MLAFVYNLVPFLRPPKYPITMLSFRLPKVPIKVVCREFKPSIEIRVQIELVPFIRHFRRLKKEPGGG